MKKTDTPKEIQGVLKVHKLIWINWGNLAFSGQENSNQENVFFLFFFIDFMDFQEVLSGNADKFGIDRWNACYFYTVSKYVSKI